MSSRSVPSGSRKYTLAPLRSAANHGPGFNANAVGFEVRYRLSDRAVPFEAEVAVTGGHRNTRDHRRPHARTVHVELLTADSVGDSPVDLDDIRAEYVSVESARTLEVADRDDDVVQAHARTIRAVAKRTAGIGAFWRVMW